MSERLALIVITFLLVIVGCNEAADVQQGTPKEDGESSFDAAVNGYSNDAINVLVVYYSMSGNTEALAKAVAEGVKRVPGVVVNIKQIKDVIKADVENAEGVILGSPTYYANIPGVMKTALDNWKMDWRVDLTNKVGAAFATGGGDSGGKEYVVISLLLYMLNNRMVVVGPLFEKPSFSYGEFGVTARAGKLDEEGRDAAARLGKRVAEVASRLQ